MPFHSLLSFLLLFPAQDQSAGARGVKVAHLAKANAPDRLPGGVSLRIDAARMTPPEIQADLLIRIATSSRLLPKVHRLTLLHDAFELAASAQEQVPLKQVDGGTDSLSGSVRKVFAAGIDRISLQAKVVAAMLPLDREGAVRLSRTVVLGEVPRRNCTDWFEYDYSPYYRMHERVGDWENIWNDFQHVSQVAPLARALLQAPAVVRLQNASRLANWLQSTATVDWHGLIAFLPDLAEDLPRLAAVLPEPHRYALADAFRTFLAAHLTKDWCGGFASQMGSPKPGEQNDALEEVAGFYARVVMPFGPPEARPLTKELMRGQVVPGRSTDRFWQQAPGSTLYRQFVDLFVRTDVLTKQTEDWRRSVGGLYHALNNWNSPPQAERTRHFLEKSTLYRYFITTASSTQPFAGSTQEEARRYFDDRKRLPILPERQRAIDDLLLWLDSHAAAHAYENRRVYWISQAQSLMVAAEQAGLDKEDLYARMRASKHPVLAAYGTVLATRLPSEE